MTTELDEIKRCALRIQQLTDALNQRTPTFPGNPEMQAISDDQAAIDLSCEFYNFAGVTTVTNDPVKEREIWTALARKARQIFSK